MEKDISIYSAMQEGTPYRIFKKTVPSKVVVKVLNPFTGEPESAIMEGDGDGKFLEVWDAQGYAFVKNMNEGHFNKGYLVEVKQKAKVELTEEQLRKLVAMVDASVQDSYNRSMNQIMNVID